MLKSRTPTSHPALADTEKVPGTDYAKNQWIADNWFLTPFSLFGCNLPLSSLRLGRPSLPSLPISTLLTDLAHALLLDVADSPGRVVSSIARGRHSRDDISSQIDRHIDQAMDRANVKATNPLEADQWLRRVAFDLIGRPPSWQELKEFLADDSDFKKEQWVDRWMASPGFLRHHTDELDTLLSYPDGGNLREYLKKAVAESKPWDQIFKDLMTADQGSDPNAPVGAFLKTRLKDIDKMTNEVSVRFFGVNISCAQCHDHPLVHDWKQDHFYGMKSFFARTFENGGFIAERGYGNVEFVTTKGERKNAKLLFLTGEELNEGSVKEYTEEEKQAEKKLLEKLRNEKKPFPAPANSRRSKLMEAGLGDQGRLLLARSIVNRLWFRFLGLGFVMPLDQMHSENPPSHPELLNWLAQDLISHDFDLKRLIRGIVLSQTYARDSSWNRDEPLPPATLYAVGRTRLLTPSQYGAALRIATLDPDSVGLRVSLEDRAKRLDDAAQAGRNWSSKFEMPRDDLQLSVAEALFLSNNKQLMSDLLKQGLAIRLSQEVIDDRAIELAFQHLLLRDPNDDERTIAKQYLQARSDQRKEAFQQLVWALCTSTEFRFNH